MSDGEPGLLSRIHAMRYVQCFENSLWLTKDFSGAWRSVVNQIVGRSGWSLLQLLHFSFPILSIASANLGWSTVSANRIYPSPDGPNPLPGVDITLASSRIFPTVSIDV